MQPSEYGVDDATATQALRQELEKLDLPSLHTKQDELVKKLDFIPDRRQALDQRVEKAKQDMDAVRLLETLGGNSADDVEKKERMLEMAIAERQRLRIEVARLEFVLKEIGGRIQFLNANRIYRASTYVSAGWREEFNQGVADVREHLARLLALYARLNNIPHPCGIKLEAFVSDILNTHNGFISKGASQQHQALVQEALELFEREGEAKMRAEDEKAAGWVEKHARDAKASKDLGGAGKNIRQIIRSEDK